MEFRQKKRLAQMVVESFAGLPVYFSSYKRATKRSSFYSIRKRTEAQELETNSWNSSLKLVTK